MTPTTIRIDDETKGKAQKLADEIGFSFSDLINVLLKKAVREGGIDLRNSELTENGFRPEFEESVLKADRKNAYKEFESVEGMINFAKK